MSFSKNSQSYLPTYIHGFSEERNFHYCISFMGYRWRLINLAVFVYYPSKAYQVQVSMKKSFTLSPSPQVSIALLNYCFFLTLFVHSSQWLHPPRNTKGTKTRLSPFLVFFLQFTFFSINLFRLFFSNKKSTVYTIRNTLQKLRLGSLSSFSSFTRFSSIEAFNLICLERSTIIVESFY